MSILEVIGALALGGAAVLVVGVAASLVISSREDEPERKYWSDYTKKDKKS